MTVNLQIVAIIAGFHRQDTIAVHAGLQSRMCQARHPRLSPRTIAACPLASAVCSPPRRRHLRQSQHLHA